MTPTSILSIARHVYETEPCARTFEEDLALHLDGGFVLSTPGVFVLARPVMSSAERELVVNPIIQFTTPDAWLIYLLAGDMCEAFAHIPFPLPLIGWERDNKLRFYETQTFESKLYAYRGIIQRIHAHAAWRNNPTVDSNCGVWFDPLVSSSPVS